MTEEIILLKAIVLRRDGDYMDVRLLNGFGEPSEMVHTSAAISIERLEGEKKADHQRQPRIKA